MNRELRISFMLSFGIHIFFMSAVVIVNPVHKERIRPYTSVDFLGPILKKTAFDIMIENVDPVLITDYSRSSGDGGDSFLKAIPIPRRTVEKDIIRRYTAFNSEGSILDFLVDSKKVPGFLIKGEEDIYPFKGEFENSRKVLYKPEEPVLIKGLYGNNERLRVGIKALVQSDGAVKKAEPVMTSGYPEVDFMAAKFVKSWIFDVKEDHSGKDEWYNLTVILTSGPEK